MDKKKKKTFAAPKIRCVAMQAAVSILAGSGEESTPPQTGFKTQSLHYGGQLIWD